MDQPDGWSDPNDPFADEMHIASVNSTGMRLSVSPRTKLLLEVLMVLMSLGAVTGNILVIVIVAATKTFHTVTSVLIINLAISDFLVGIGVMPFVAVSVMSDAWVSCTDLCLYVGYTSSVYCTASVLTLAAIALDRYHSIIDCLRYSSRCTLWRTGAAVLWIWLQAMVTSCPPLLGWSRVDYVGPMYSCAVNWSSSPSYTTFMAAFSFLLPAAVILFCYVRIVKVARSHARRIHDLEDHLQRSRGLPAAPHLPGSDPARLSPSPFQDAPTSSRLVYYLSGRFVPEADMDRNAPGVVLPDQPCGPEAVGAGAGRLHSFFAHLHSSAVHHQHGSQQHHGVVRLLLVISAFFLCWTPYVSVTLVQAVETALSRRSSLVPPAAITFSYWLVLLNSDINPLLYALLSKRFQGALKSLRCKLQARLGNIVGRGDTGGPGGGEGECGDHDPCTVTAAHRHPNPSPNNVPSERTAYHSSVFSLDSNFAERYTEHLNSVFLPGSVSSSSCSLWQDGSGECSLRKVDHLQVPAQPQEGDRLPSSAATKDRQATFFYGQITVRVEHDVG
ncbi:5-hydroxytryptamine receptor 1D [Megalops cyprinoides]|uniref:5-hydroxytryptamine receptor 1D n=1 Tax=Megalops cyprinoides TaxID=118141 RepID=UPI001864D6D7|nr:5-hydroxytryptamine receptor 1D [Megalops cyprinoides]